MVGGHILEFFAALPVALHSLKIVEGNKSFSDALNFLLKLQSDKNVFGVTFPTFTRIFVVRI